MFSWDRQTTCHPASAGYGEEGTYTVGGASFFRTADRRGQPRRNPMGAASPPLHFGLHYYVCPTTTAQNGRHTSFFPAHSHTAGPDSVFPWICPLLSSSSALPRSRVCQSLDLATALSGDWLFVGRTGEPHLDDRVPKFNGHIIQDYGKLEISETAPWGLIESAIIMRSTHCTRDGRVADLQPSDKGVVAPL